MNLPRPDRGSPVIAVILISASDFLISQGNHAREASTQFQRNGRDGVLFLDCSFLTTRDRLGTAILQLGGTKKIFNSISAESQICF